MTYESTSSATPAVNCVRMEVSVIVCFGNSQQRHWSPNVCIKWIYSEESENTEAEDR